MSKLRVIFFDHEVITREQNEINKGRRMYVFGSLIENMQKDMAPTDDNWWPAVKGVKQIENDQLHTDL